MAFRSDLDAAQHRANALERRVADLEEENELLRKGQKGLVPTTSSSKRWGSTLAVSSALLVGSALIGPIALLVAAGVSTALIAAKANQLYPRPGEVIVVSGGQHRRPDGSVQGFRVIKSGPAYRTPLLESASAMSIEPFAVEFMTGTAYTEPGVPVSIEGSAQVRVSLDSIENAVERFLGRDVSEMAQVADQVIEGHMRGLVATATLEELEEDNQAMAEMLIQEVQADLAKLGMQIDSLEFTARAPYLKFPPPTE